MPPRWFCPRRPAFASYTSDVGHARSHELRPALRNAPRKRFDSLAKATAKTPTWLAPCTCHTCGCPRTR
eukprot:4314970-Alexandrium_andersonii.AAC.1